MSLLALSLVVIAVLVTGYLLYGSYLARQLRLDDANITPATARSDGVDFIPTRPFYLLAQHFSAIAAAGPIAGPILACAAFGWGPCVLWIVVGVVLIGAVHDMAALVASVRHGAHSIAEVARRHLGPTAYYALVAFIWLALLYVITAFTQITASTFVGKAEELEGLNVQFNKGGAVAMASTLYLLLTLVMGVVQRWLRPPMWLVTAIFVPMTLVCVWAGTQLDGVLDLPLGGWSVAILVYCLVASLLPMWLLQQPRGYLGGFVLYLAIGVGLLGVLLGGYEVKQPFMTEAALRTLNPLSAVELMQPGATPASTPLLMPFLFVTIACGACSGFHGLICGGTTSKQVAKESHCKAIGFGAMLLEGLVAVIALSTIMILAPSEMRTATGALKPAGTIYGDGLASYLTIVLGPGALMFCATFGAMAFSTFVFDTLDVSTRLGRYLLTELYMSARGRRGEAGNAIGGERAPLWVSVLAAGLTAGVPLLLLTTADGEAYRLFWTLFGTSNQLLAALTLLGVTVWLRRSGRRCWYVFWPMVVMMVITVWALALQVAVGVRDAVAGKWRTDSGDLNATWMNALVGIALLALAVVFIVAAARATKTAGPEAAAGGKKA